MLSRPLLKVAPASGQAIWRGYHSRRQHRCRRETSAEMPRSIGERIGIDPDQLSRAMA